MKNRSDEAGKTTRETPQELLHEVRTGNLDAAYELLGRQAPVRTWSEALDHIAHAPEQADLELAAHRALRRPQQVVAGLLDLVAAVHSAKAAHVAHAISRLRAEKQLSERAVEVRGEIQRSLDLDASLEQGDGLGALYLVLTTPLIEQRDALGRLSAQSLKLVVGALEAEYQRLLELGRAVRWTSGSYRYFLRHSLADLALVADTGGRTWDLAYRLLQQHVENPQENQELISILPEGTRRRFLAWALDRENAGQHLERTRFVLASARRHPGDIGRDAVIGVLKVDDPDTRAEALITAVALAPGASDVDRGIAEYLATADRSSASRLVTAILGIEPSRLRPDLLSADNRELVAEVGGKKAPDIARRIAARLPELRETDAIRGVVDMLDQLDERHSIPSEVYAQVALDLMRRTHEDSRWQTTLDDLLASPGVLRGAWEVLPSLDEPARTREYRSIVARTDPHEAGLRTARLLEKTPETSPAFCAVVVDALVSGDLDPEELRAAPDTALHELAIEARVRIQAIERDIEVTRDALGKGHTSVEQELREKLRPIVERAIERAEGNERLAGDYRRLLPSVAPSDVDVTTHDQTPSIPESARLDLEKVGAELKVGDGAPEIDFTEQADRAPRLRYLAVLDKKARRSSEQGWLLMLEAYISALGRSGEAGQMITDLFERGPSMKLALGLSADSRQQLLQAAIDNGLDVPDVWTSHDALGDWLTSVLGLVPDEPSEQIGGDALDLLLHTRARAQELEGLRERAVRLEHDAKLAFVSECRSVFDDLELAIDGYVQLWRALAGLGISQVEPLGSIVERESLDAERHQIVGATNAASYMVRAAGIAVDDQIVAPARVERAEV